MTDSPGGAGGVDQIVDFSRDEGDTIDLSAIDAHIYTQGDEAFTFVGTSAFSGTAGELRLEVIEGKAHLFADINGDGLADFGIVVHAPTIQASELIL